MCLFEKVELHNAVATLGTAMTHEHGAFCSSCMYRSSSAMTEIRLVAFATYKFAGNGLYILPFEIVDNKYGLEPMKPLIYAR